MNTFKIKRTIRLKLRKFILKLFPELALKRDLDMARATLKNVLGEQDKYQITNEDIFISSLIVHDIDKNNCKVAYCSEVRRKLIESFVAADKLYVKEIYDPKKQQTEYRATCLFKQLDENKFYYK